MVGTCDVKEGDTPNQKHSDYEGDRNEYQRTAKDEMVRSTWSGMTLHDVGPEMVLTKNAWLLCHGEKVAVLGKETYLTRSTLTQFKPYFNRNIHVKNMFYFVSIHYLTNASHSAFGEKVIEM